MKKNPLTGRWEFLPIELFMEQDHQGHLVNWRRHQVAERWKHTELPEVPTIYTRDGKLRPSSPTRPAYRNPTPQEDPHAYTVGFS